MVTQLPSPSCFTTGTGYWSLIHCWFWYPEEASKTRPVLSTTSEDLYTFFIAPSICLARLTKLSLAYLASYFQLRFEITRLEVQRYSGYQLCLLSSNFCLVSFNSCLPFLGDDWDLPNAGVSSDGHFGLYITIWVLHSSKCSILSLVLPCNFNWSFSRCSFNVTSFFRPLSPPLRYGYILIL